MNKISLLAGHRNWLQGRIINVRNMLVHMTKRDTFTPDEASAIKDIVASINKLLDNFTLQTHILIQDAKRKQSNTEETNANPES